MVTFDRQEIETGKCCRTASAVGFRSQRGCVEPAEEAGRAGNRGKRTDLLQENQASYQQPLTEKRLCLLYHTVAGRIK